MQTWENIVKIGTIVELHNENKALVKVQISSRISDFLPVLMFANSFKKRWEPIRVKEQVVVLHPFGNANFGVVLRGICNKSCKEPNEVSSSCEVTEYEDGTRFSYDTKTKKLSISCVGNIELNAKSITIKALNTNFDGGAITHNNTPIDDTHLHTQTNGNHYGGDSITTAPNKGFYCYTFSI